MVLRSGQIRREKLRAQKVQKKNRNEPKNRILPRKMETGQSSHLWSPSSIFHSTGLHEHVVEPLPVPRSAARVSYEFPFSSGPSIRPAGFGPGMEPASGMRCGSWPPMAPVWILYQVYLPIISNSLRLGPGSEMGFKYNSEGAARTSPPNMPEHRGDGRTWCLGAAGRG